jgi:hypothetical protein
LNGSLSDGFALLLAVLTMILLQQERLSIALLTITKQRNERFSMVKKFVIGVRK